MDDDGSRVTTTIDVVNRHQGIACYRCAGISMKWRVNLVEEQQQDSDLPVIEWFEATPLLTQQFTFDSSQPMELHRNPYKNYYSISLVSSTEDERKFDIPCVWDDAVAVQSAKK